MLVCSVLESRGQEPASAQAASRAIGKISPGTAVAFICVVILSHILNKITVTSTSQIKLGKENRFHGSRNLVS